MALKTRRQARYEKFRQGNAFLPFEAQPLSRINIAICPYLQFMIDERRAERREALNKGLTLTQWENEIKSRYNKNGWLKRGRTGKILADPWKMLRNYEDRFRQKHPEYESPWEPRYKNMRDFMAKIERTMAKQRGVA